MKNQKKQQSSGAGDGILHCDTLSTESPNNSAVSMSPVNGEDDNDDQNRAWLNTRLRRHDEDEGGINQRNLNDAVILTNLRGIISIPNITTYDDDILIAPSTIEERQNEKFARKVGINL